MNNGNVTGNTASVAGGGIANVSPFGAPLGAVTLHNTQVNGNNPNNCIPVGSIAGCNDSVFVFTAALDGPSQNPPVASPGTGNRDGDVGHTHQRDDRQRQLQRPHDGDDRVAHPLLRRASRQRRSGDDDADVPGFPLGVTAGTYTRTFDMTDPASYNPAFVTANGGTTGAEAALLAGLQAGQAYLNIHTTMFPGGEIRGFLQQP